MIKNKRTETTEVQNVTTNLPSTDLGINLVRIKDVGCKSTDFLWSSVSCFASPARVPHICIFSVSLD